MLHLITGSNGAGKTLFTLKWVRERSLKENRKVYYNGRFKLKQEIETQFGWEKFEFKDWQSMPDGAIFLVDECHNDLPNRPTGSKVPDEVRMLAEHRARGFDFYLITQHPSNIDTFVRKLIGAPGWHRHLKRIAGAAPAVNMMQWDSCNVSCEARGSSRTAHTNRKLKYPTDVYKWYDSTSLNTAQYSIPKTWIYAAAAVIGCAILLWHARYTLMDFFKPEQQTQTHDIAPAPGTNASPRGASQSTASDQDKSLSPSEYVASYTPRIPGLPYTAPRYDQITQPVTAPRPAACLTMGTWCRCYSQQGTRLPGVPDQLCRHIVKHGFFEDWASDSGTGHIQQRPQNHIPPEPLT